MNNKRWDALYIGGTLATCVPGNQTLGIIEKAALGIKEGKIDWVGRQVELPADYLKQAREVHEFQHQCITPALIDCHTHLVYAGNRAKEFEMRLNGASYIEIAKAGGGIRSTVAATRAASEEELLEQSLKRASAMLAQGVTTIEIKSGYGLDLETELKMLRVAKCIGEILPITVFTTFLGAHTVPKEFEGNTDTYLDVVCEEMIPRIVEEKLADAVDVFCEKIAFNLAQAERVFQTAMDHGLRVKCHAEQLSDSGSASLAARYNALSVDHLEFLAEKNIPDLVKADTTAVLLPGAYYFLREKQQPPVALLRQYGVPMAIATDCNPGTSPTTSLPLMMNMACVLFNLTPIEAWLGVTSYAAKALGIEARKGSIEVGKEADVVLWDMRDPVDLVYSFGVTPCLKLVNSDS